MSSLTIISKMIKEKLTEIITKTQIKTFLYNNLKET